MIFGDLPSQKISIWSKYTLFGRKVEELVEEGTKATKVPTSDFTIPFGCAWILVLALVLWILRSLDLLLNKLMGEVATG